MERIERAGRTCYKSENKATVTSAKEFAEKLIRSKHLSVIEHSFASVRIVTSRGISHELVRHRLASFSQESTRYVNYKNRGLEVIIPEWALRSCPKKKLSELDDRLKIWIIGIRESVKAYIELLKTGLRPEDARGNLPIDLKTEIVISANLREWIHIFKQRTSPKVHPQMKQLMFSILSGFRKEIPVLFDNI